jgi:alginate O-acetyltransferase complex protein AlgI
MSAYRPSDPGVAAVLFLAFLVVLLFGHVVARHVPTRVARVVAWITLVAGTFGVERWVRGEPAGVRMLALVGFALLAMKLVVVVEERARGMPPLPFGAWLGFAGGWLGMDPRPFLATERGRLPGAGTLVRRGIVFALAGACLFYLARFAWARTGSEVVATGLVLLALSLVVHFGFCAVLAGLWRFRGVDVSALFRAPLRSESLSEFWSRRWNLAFSEMTATSVYRPLRPALGRGAALMAGFALSGLLHEMAISAPVRTGFGLPLLYFMIHGGLVLLERALSKRGHAVSGWFGRAWTAFWLLAPLPLLFHPPFLAGVIWPLVF